MSRKDVVLSKLVNPVDSTQKFQLSSSFNSPATIIRYLDNVSYQINITTTNSIGVFTVQASLDYAVNESTNAVTNAGNWEDLTLSSTLVSNAANDVILVNLNQVPFNALRVSYTSSTAGTGTCEIFFMGKQIGG